MTAINVPERNRAIKRLKAGATIIIDFTELHKDALATSCKKTLYLAAGQQRELFGYILEKSGINNGYHFVSIDEYAHVEQRFRHMYHALYVQSGEAQ